MFEEKARSELFRHIVDPDVVLKEAKDLLKKGEIRLAEEALNPILAGMMQRDESGQSRSQPIFDYYPALWRLYAEVMKKKGDDVQHFMGETMADTCEITLGGIKRVVEKEVEALGGGKRSAEIWIKTADAFDEDQRDAESLHCLREAYKLDKTNQILTKRLLVGFVNARYYSSAEDLARKVIKSGDPDDMFKEMLAISLVFQKKYKDAVPIISDVVAADASKGVMWQLLSIAHGNLGQNKEAADALRKMIDLNFNGVQARRILNELETIGVPGMPGMTMRVRTAAAVETSDDDSVISQDEHILMKLMLDRKATSEATGLGPLAEEGNSWMNSVLENLVAKGFAVLTKSRKAYLTEKGMKRIQRI